MNTDIMQKTSVDIHKQGKMLDIIIALVPAGLAGIYFFGASALTLICTCVASCVLFEYLWQKLINKTNMADALGAIVTGLLLAYALPPATPLWLASVGALIAIIFVKQLYGGTGFLNPAFAGKLFVAAALASYAGGFLSPSIFGLDSLPCPTTLMLIKEGNMAGLLPITDVIFGNACGCTGQTSAILILIGGLYLILKKVISYVLPLAFIGTVAILTFVFSPDKSLAAMFTFMMYNVFGGGLFLGALFAAADEETSPKTTVGKAVAGVFCGIITAVIRLWGAYPDGTVHAILLMNIITPIIDKLTLPLPAEEEITE